MSGCEVEALTPGAELVIVGFGESSTSRGGGVRREATATLTALGNELAVQIPGGGTCAGDSGGGAFMRVGGAWRLAAVPSSGETADCSDGPSYFTPIWPFLPWIEQESGFEKLGGASIRLQLVRRLSEARHEAEFEQMRQTRFWRWPKVRPR
jgi:hypothetical protein